MSKKIAFFMTSLHTGGGERVMIDLANHLVSLGEDVSIVVMKRSGSFQSRIAKKVRIVDIDTNRFVRAFVRCVIYLRKEKPDVVFSSYIHFNLVMLIALFFSGVRARSIIRIGIPLSVVFAKLTSFTDRVIVPLLTRILYPMADVVWVVSKGIADDVSKVAHLSREKITVIYNPKNAKEIQERAHQQKPEVFSKTDGPFIVSAGRFTAQKDFPTLIQAFSIVHKEIGGHLVLLGDGSVRTEIETMVTNLDLDQYVSFEGNQENPFAYMKHADVFALSSRWEGLPNVLLEALACGTPIVATDCPSGGPREILAPETDYRVRLKGTIEKTATGYLVPVGDAALLATAIKYILQHKPTVDPFTFNTLDEATMLFTEMTAS